MIPDSAARLAFGDFVFDVASGDLHHNGSVTRLAPQVAAVLLLLARRAGEVVTRAELQDALWPDTTVEFDRGLNFCVRQLRVALADDATQPKYIETLHRRGYRFVAAVSAVAVEQIVEQVAGNVPISTTRENPPKPFARFTIRGVTAVALSLVVVLMLSWWLARGAAFPTFASQRIAVLRFDVAANDPLVAYQGQLAELLLTSVGRGQLDKLAVMGPSFTSRFAAATPPDSIRAAIGATHVLSGSLRADSGMVRVFAQLIRTSDKRHLWAHRFVDSTGISGSRMASIADSIGRAVTDIVARDP